MDKKEISVKTSVKAIITGFVAYGILLGFLAICVKLIINAIINALPNSNLVTLSYSLPLLGIFVIYFVIHGLCRLSTYDVFKKCKTNEENIDNISRKMNLFFIICIIFSVVFSIATLSLSNTAKYQSIELAKLEYGSVFSNDFTNQLTNSMINDFNKEKTYSLISTTILELGFVVSFFSLIPFQKKMLKLYNSNDAQQTK